MLTMPTLLDKSQHIIVLLFFLSIQAKVRVLQQITITL